MKVALSKKLLADMPSAMRSIVEEWKSHYRKRTIRVVARQSFYPGENARVTLINLATGAEQTAQAAGEFAGFTPLSPCAEIPLKPGVVAVVREICLGVPMLTIHQCPNGNQPTGIQLIAGESQAGPEAPEAPEAA